MDGPRTDDDHSSESSAVASRLVYGSLAFARAAVVGVLGGMIGLGGAEFRLPLLITLFGFVALQAVIANQALSLMVVLATLPARLARSRCCLLSRCGVTQSAVDRGPAQPLNASASDEAGGQQQAR